MNKQNFMPVKGTSHRHKIAAYTALIFIITCFFVFAVPVVRQFLIVDYKTDKILYSSSVKPGDKFSITYIHSVNKSPVEDQFELAEDFTILLRKSIFKSFGAGVPSNLNDGDKFEYFDDRIEVSYNSSRINKFILFVGVIADHHFLMNGRDIKLNELSPPQRSVHFTVKKITVFQYFKYINKSGGNR